MMNTHLFFFYPVVLLLLLLNSANAQISMIGTATPAGDVTTDFNLNQNPVNSGQWTLSVGLQSGQLKFRANGSWAINWGGNGFPSGTLAPGGPLITVTTPGYYQISIDTSSGSYQFTLLPSSGSAGSVGIGTDVPTPSAALEVVATDKGLLIPRVTSAQREAIPDPAIGLMVFDMSTDSYWYRGRSGWEEVGAIEETDPRVGDLDTNYIPKWSGTALINTQSIYEDTGGQVVISNLTVGPHVNSSPAPGAIRWNPATEDFEGFTGTSWRSLTQSNLFSKDINLKLTAEDGQAKDEFGTSVAISGDYAIVGAPEEDTQGANAGAAYIYKKSGGVWLQQAKLVAGDADPGDLFGYSVAISGDYAIVGAYLDNDPGAAYIFHREGSSWTEQAKLVAGDADPGDNFGYSVAISGDYAVIGAYLDDEKGANAGAAYIFHRQGNAWTQQSKLTAADGVTDDQFGYSVAISGSYAIVGARWEDEGGTEAGAAYVFHRNGNVWTEEAKLLANDPQSDDYFGYSVAISGNYAIIGAWGEDEGAFTAGAAYIFRFDGNNWTQQAKLLANDPQLEDRFGVSVAMEEDYVIIGAFSEDEGALNAGAAYIFRRQGATWNQISKLIAPDAETEDRFGQSVGLSGPYVIIGASWEDTGGTEAGAVYIFK